MFGALSAIALVLGSGSPFDGAARWVRLLVTGALVASVIAVVSASPLGRLSGAHLNPAVTVAFGVLGMVPRRDLVGYVVAQLAGALAGAAAFRVAWGSVAASVEGGVTHPSIAVAGAIGLEAAMTAALLAVIFACASRERWAPWTPLAIWPVLTVMVAAAGPLTGASLNPARSAGPAVAAGDLADLWVYVAGPLLGAAALAGAWRALPPARHPFTAKLCHDQRYATAFRSSRARAPTPPAPPASSGRSPA